MVKWLKSAIKYIYRLFQIEPYTTNSWINDTKSNIDKVVHQLKYQVDSESDEVDHRMFVWNLGDIYPHNDKLSQDHDTQIQSLHVSDDNLSFSWKKGSLSNWGYKYNEKGAVACLFYNVCGQWVGGRFDWVSTSQLHIPLTNILNNYYGWDYRFINNAREFAFFIMDPSGRVRTNIIHTTL
jgi:hypothetical protein